MEEAEEDGSGEREDGVTWDGKETKGAAEDHEEAEDPGSEGKERTEGKPELEGEMDQVIESESLGEE